MTSTTSWPRTAASGICIREGRSPRPPQERPPLPTVPPCVDSGWSLLLAADNDRLRHHRCRKLPISLCSRIFRRAIGPTISRSLGFQALPTSFGQSVQHLNAASLIHRTNQFRPKFIAHSGANRLECMLDDHQATLDAVLRGRGWFYEPAGQVGGRARRHSWWTSQPSTTSTNAMTPVG